MNEHPNDLEKRMDERFNRVDERFDRVDERFKEVGEHLGRVDADVRELRVAVIGMQRTMNQGVIAICGVMATGFAAVLGTTAF